MTLVTLALPGVTGVCAGQTTNGDAVTLSCADQVSDPRAEVAGPVRWAVKPHGPWVSTLHLHPRVAEQLIDSYRSRLTLDLREH